MRKFGPRPIVRSMGEHRDEPPRPTTIQAQGAGEGGIIMKGWPEADPPEPELVPIIHNLGNTGNTRGF